MEPSAPIRSFRSNCFGTLAGREQRPTHALFGLCSSRGEVRVLDYIEGQGQVVGYYTHELHHPGYQKATCYLPHDGVHTNNVTGLRYANHLKDAEFRVEVVPNQGAGAAAMRIEAVRRVFHFCRFDEKKCNAGVEALGFYHEKKDDQRDVCLGPSRDWSISYEGPVRKARFNRKLDYGPHTGIV